MRLGVAATIALVAVGRHGLRSALAMVGLVIGVAAVLTMVALGRGAREAVTGEMRSAGTNLVFVRAGNYTRGGDAVHIPSGFGKAETLRSGDAEALGEIAGVVHLTPEVDDRVHVAAADRRVFLPVLGCGSELPSVYGVGVVEGRFFDRREAESGAGVAVLSGSAKDVLFPDGGEAVGRTISIGDTSATVLGVVDMEWAASHRESVFVPYALVQRALGINYLHGITMAAEQAGDASVVSEAARRVLRKRHGLDDPARAASLPKATSRFAVKRSGPVPDDFTVHTQAARALTQGLYTTAAAFALASMPRLDETTSEEMVNTLTQANDTMSLLLSGIAAVSLIVGGIGIMNVMLLAVTERTMEIGIRMSVGARRRDVLAQFMIEALVLSFGGGAAGIALGFASAGALTRVLGWPTEVTPAAVALGIGLAVAVGLTFGYYPAWRAARLHPIDALGYE